MGLEGTSRGHVIQPLAQDRIITYWAILDEYLSNLPLQSSKNRDSRTSLDSLFQCSHSHSEKVPNIQLKFLYCNLRLLLNLSPATTKNNLLPCSLWPPPFMYLSIWTLIKSCLCLLSSRLNNPRSSNPSLGHAF